MKTSSLLSLCRYPKSFQQWFFCGIMVLVIFIARFLIEFLKADQVVKEANMVLNIGQKLSIPMILLGIAFLTYSFIKKDKIPVYDGPKEKPVPKTEKKK